MKLNFFAHPRPAEIHYVLINIFFMILQHNVHQTVSGVFFVLLHIKFLRFKVYWYKLTHSALLKVLNMNLYA